MLMSKYRAKKVVTEEGTFDSKHEYCRWRELKLLQEKGIICDLRRQVRYELIPKCRNQEGKLVREASYIADFVYTENGQTVVEDTKGFKTETYKLKKKLMYHVHGIWIKET